MSFSFELKGAGKWIAIGVAVLLVAVAVGGKLLKAW